MSSASARRLSFQYAPITVRRRLSWTRYLMTRKANDSSPEAELIIHDEKAANDRQRICSP